MVYQERNTWVQLIASVIGLVVYTVLILQQIAMHPIGEIEWWPIMLWTIVGGIAFSIAFGIAWGILAGMREPDEMGRSDERDLHISRMGSRVGQSFMVIAGLGVLVLCAFEVDWFWIANTMYYGFAVSAFVGGLASVIAYRRGLV